MIRHLALVWQFRYFWSALVGLDLRQRYRKSVLGIGWSMLHPLCMSAVMCFALATIFKTDNWRTLGPYVLGALAVWELIKASLVFGCDTFVRNESYIRQCPLPYTVYTLRTVLGLYIHFFIALGMAVLGVGIMSDWPADLPMRLVAIVPSLLLLGVFCWSGATIAAFVHSYFHDTKHLIEAVTQFLFFLTPIMFLPIKAVEVLGPWVLNLNPAAQFIMMISFPLASGEVPTTTQYGVLAAMTAAIFGLACGTQAWLSKRLIFQL